MKPALRLTIGSCNAKRGVVWDPTLDEPPSHREFLRAVRHPGQGRVPKVDPLESEIPTVST
jgi:hypothetical protein